MTTVICTEENSSALEIPAVHVNKFVVHIVHENFLRLLTQEILGTMQANRGAFILDVPSARALAQLLLSQADAAENPHVEEELNSPPINQMN